MTLEEAIKNAKEVAKKQHYESDKAALSFALFPNGDDEERFNKCESCAEEHEQLAEWLEELKAYKENEQKWISVADRLPRPYEDVLADVRGIGFDSSKNAMMVGYFNGKWFHSHGMMYLVNGEKTKVIAWMPLPLPAKINE